MALLGIFLVAIICTLGIGGLTYGVLGFFVHPPHWPDNFLFAYGGAALLALGIALFKFMGFN